MRQQRKTHIRGDMSRVLACVPADEVAEARACWAGILPDAVILWQATEFVPVPEVPYDPARDVSCVPQIILYTEEDFFQNDNVYRIMACRDFEYLFFSKAANPCWRTNSGPGHVSQETDLFVLWRVTQTVSPPPPPPSPS